MQSIEGITPAEPTAADLIHQYVLIAWRNRLLIAGSMAVSLVLAGSYYVFATKYFQSQTLIVADGSGVDNVIGGGDSEGKFEKRLYLIQKQIVNRDFMSGVAQDLGLYPEGADEREKSKAVGTLLDWTRVERIKNDPALGMSNQTLIEGFVVSFLHEDPNTAQRVVQRIGDKFIQDTNREREMEVAGTGEFLDEELRLMKQELEKKEEHISQFKKLHLGGLPTQTDANMRTLDRVEADITRTTEDLQRHSDKMAMLNQAVQQYRVSGQQSPMLGISRSTEVDPLFKRLRELREQLVKLRAEFWDGYPEVVLVKEEIRRVEEELVNLYGRDAIRADKTQLDPYLQELAKLQSEARTEISLLQRRLEQLHTTRGELEKRLERSPVVEQELLVLERDYSNMKDNYAKLLDKRLHTRVQENAEKRQKGGKFRILDRANFPRDPAIPSKVKVVLLGIVFGCVSGAGLTILRERLTPQFRGPEDIEILLAGPRLLASIPDFSSLWHTAGDQQPAQSSALPRLSLGLNLRSPRSEVVPDKRSSTELVNFRELDKRFVSKIFPRSMAAEQYRVAAARLQLINATGAPVVAAVTSAIKGEGKTTTVVNLGYTLARDFGRRVLLLDCDFVFPELSAFVETPAKHGLIDCLRSDIPPQQAMSALSDVPCWIMQAGESVGNSTELLRAGQLDRVLSQLRDEFDYILLNAPPILPVATMNVLESHCDLHILVVRANVTSKQAVKQAVHSLRADKPIHIVLNGVASNSLPSYMIDYSAGERSVAV